MTNGQRRLLLNRNSVSQNGKRKKAPKRVKPAENSPRSVLKRVHPREALIAQDDGAASQLMLVKNSH